MLNEDVRTVSHIWELQKDIPILFSNVPHRGTLGTRYTGSRSGRNVPAGGI